MKTVLALFLILMFYAHAQEDVIRIAMTAQLEAPQLRSSVTMDIDGETSTSIIDYVAPDRFRVQNETSEIIVIGDTTYQNDGNGWDILEVNMAAIINQYRNASILEKITLSNLQVLTDETLDGKPCTVYSYTQDFEGIVSEDKLWVEKSTGLPLKLESQGDVLGTASRSVTLYDYDSGLEIAAPMQ